MATRSLIAHEKEDGSIDSIYCHWGGAPDENGVILTKEYPDAVRVESLIALGNVSSIAPEVKAYHKDMGEDWEDVKPEHYSSLAEYLSIVSKRYNDVDFVYVFSKAGAWTCYKNGSNEPQLIPQ